jgi:indole-3-glycerol phosphate synthase
VTPTPAAAPDLLGTIVAATRRAVEVRSAARSIDALARTVQRKPDGKAFESALAASRPPRIIAECKRRSPSRGILRQHYEPAGHASAYAAAGAAAISVLTEPTFFDGSLDHLRQVRAAVTIPILRKDFIVAEYQLVEAAANGADAVLLIVKALDQAELRTLVAQAQALGLATLVEAHDPGEIVRAVDAGARVVGVNSRNLQTLSVDPQVLESAARLLPRDVVAVAESGIRDLADVDRLSELGYHAFLIGERLMTQPDPGEALRQLRQQRLQPERAGPREQ